MKQGARNRVVKHVLSNGLTVLVYPVTTIPKVSSQMWYNVGSKHELTGERGLAHFLEHLIFKGTEKLSESDLTMITYKLSGYCNAFTSYDYTGYLFDFPQQHWKTSLELFADSMHNCTFKQQHINSELKAVIQELKLYKDDYISSLMEDMISLIFTDHPYHHPIIGYKQDLWSITRDSLLAFYRKHYIPNNATLVVLGDVSVDEVVDTAEKQFMHLKADPNYKQPVYYHSEDVSARSITLYRDIQQSVSMIAFVVPGMKEKKSGFAALASWIIATGKGSRLYKTLVEDKKLVSYVEATVDDLFDYSVFFITFYPYDDQDCERIIDVIKQELDFLIRDGFTDHEMERAFKRVKVDHLTLQENNQEFAYGIGQSFLATGDEQYMLDYLSILSKIQKDDLHFYITTYLRPSRAHTGLVLPLVDSEKQMWVNLQEESDQLDESFLSKKIRTEPVEKGVAVEHVHVLQPKPFTFPRAEKSVLGNGLTVLHHHTNRTEKIEVVLDLKTYHAYDTEEKQGLLYFTSMLLAEGTKNYSAQELADELESRGMSLDIKPGLFSLSMLRNDFEKGLELLTEMIMQPTFEQKAIKNIRGQMEAALKNYWDNPSEFIRQLARDIVYAGHPYAYNKLGTFKSIMGITRADIMHCHETYISPQEGRLVVVGDIAGYDLQSVCEKTIGQWQGPPVKDFIHPILRPPHAAEKNYPMNRDQIALGFAGLSVSRLDPSYDALLLFDQIFTGGLLGSMSSRLFMLREQSGLFYSIGGSLVFGADVIPGMVMLQTLVSRDRLNEAEKAIKDVIAGAASYIGPEELVQAKSAVSNALVDHFASNYQTAITFLFIDKYGMPADYFDTRAEYIAKISREQVQDAVRPILDTNRLVTLRIGRV